MLATTGCGEKRRVSREANSLSAAYVVHMEKGNTTREQDQRFIKAISQVAYELDRNIRGDKKAKATRQAAQKLATSGLDPNSNFNIEDGDRGVPKKKAEMERSPESILAHIETLLND